MSTLLPGINSQQVSTGRGRFHVIEAHPQLVGIPVVFIHGNVSSSLFFQPTMLDLDRHSYAIDLRGFGDSETLPVDARRGLRDFSDDVAAVLDALRLTSVHLVGWSMGGGVSMQLLLDRRDLVASLTLISPVSPYGFGGTSLDGTLLSPDAAGTGGGGANQDFLASMASRETSDSSSSTARSVFRATYVAPGYRTDLEDLWVESMLSTALGEDNYPGDSVASESWPGFAAGTRGILNTMAPTHFNTTAIVDLDDKPAILWVRGDQDAIVSDETYFDLNTLGRAGIIPGWPGDQVAPPQPMVAQTRAVLECYRAQGGRVREIVHAGVGHSAHLERPEEFRAALSQHITESESTP
ncbi:alpha/beta fold hydrolase [Tessaracoccus sp. SD287]|uniref:alpha/beta fold hydrolase n=1 Tax=Tessaracoccus sp. SD287 TaxID=2782008 RepID=UPI001A976991|nr:alpha/beta hydrolase [Tessaracoccus sp. SD287]MBO1029791.1 alpha/beta fold hydrolase [Tessaracoccus sp. SD287]